MRAARRERRRLERLPRYQPTTTTLFGAPFHIVDAAAFLAEYRQIFDARMYEFDCEADRPRIIDCGANMGLTVLYWKRRWPRARVVAFEADPVIFGTLERNCSAQGVSDDVTLVPAAVWTETGTMRFWQEGAAAGRLVDEHAAVDDGRVVDVPAVALADYLTDPVDLLKLDIEGAEVEVLAACAWRLAAVERIFVEWHSFKERPQQFHRLLEILHDGGYRVHILPEVVAARPFIERIDYMGMDHQLNVFAYRR
jgi:FkbM family methyltransferase